MISAEEGPAAAQHDVLSQKKDCPSKASTETAVIDGVDSATQNEELAQPASDSLTAVSDSPTYPEGGLVAWTNVLGAYVLALHL